MEFQPSTCTPGNPSLELCHSRPLNIKSPKAIIAETTCNEKMDNPDDDSRSNGPVDQSLAERKSGQRNQMSELGSGPQLPGDGSCDSRSESSIPLQLLNRERGSSLASPQNEVPASASTMESISGVLGATKQAAQQAAQQTTQHETTQQTRESPPNVRQDEQTGSSAHEKTKKDRSKLRKGKWTVEEEEYTSRIIQHFSTGLLTLPDGATLRSYLAEKLNCDPMRITKKFTGACCLGRRVYHLREKPRGSPAEIEMAKAELQHLEQRFRMRVEHEQSGLPLSRQQEMLLAQPSTAPSPLYPIQGFAAGGGNSVWGTQFGSGGIPPLTSTLAALQGNPTIQGLNRPSPSPLAALGASTGQWMLPPGSEINVPPPQISSLPDQSLLLLNNLVNSWAWSQATAALRPTFAKLGVPSPSQAPTPIHLKMQNQAEQQSRQTNEDLQRQLRETFEEHKREEQKRAQQNEAESQETKPPAQLPQDSNSKAEIISPAEQLQKSYEEHLKSLNLQQEVSSGVRSDDNTMSTNCTADSKGASANQAEAPRAANRPQKKEQSTKIDEYIPKSGNKEKRAQVNRSTETAAAAPNETPPADEEAGTILLGFLNSLRRSYEDAVDVTDQKEEDASNEEKTSADGDGRAGPVSSQVSSVSHGSNESQVSTDIDDPKVSKGHGARKKRSLTTMAPPENLRGGSIEMSEREAPFRNTASASRSSRPASVTDTSTLSRSETSSGTSNPTESSSSLEDSDSKSDKTDGSSSEESEKECQVKMTSKGPPRKRLKARKFTKQNLMEHSNRLQRASDESMDQSGF